MNLLDQLPLELKTFKPEFEKHLRHSREINLEYSKTESNQSNLYGMPYVPAGFEFPIGRNGEPFKYFAQLNFSEVEKIPGYPSKGLLVIFLGNPLSDLVEIETKGYFYDDLNEKPLGGDLSPILKADEESRKMTFASRQELPHCYTSEYEENLENLFDKKVLGLKSAKEVQKVYAQYEELTEAHIDSKIGGYSMFGQIDYDEFDESGEYQLLLEIGQGDISSGRPSGLGMGAIMIFIKKSDLQNRKFDALRTYFECD